MSSNFCLSSPTLVIEHGFDFSHVKNEYEMDLIVILICIFLMTDDVEHFFFCAYWPFVYFFGEISIQIVAYFKIGLFYCCCKGSLYCLDTSLLSGLQIFSPILWFIFSLSLF